MKLNTLIIQLLAASVLAIASSACSKNEQEDVPTTILKEQILTDATPLTINKAWYPIDSIYPTQFYVYADTILIVENQKAAGNFLDFYNIRTQKLIAKELPFGEGPDELLFAQMNYDGNSMRVTDYINRKMCNVNINQVLKEENYKPELLPFSKNNIITTSPVSFGDSILFVNPFHYVNLQEGINQQPPRLIASTPDNPEPPMPMDYDYMTFNVGQGLLGANLHLGKVFFASFETSLVEFYDSNLKLIRKVLGPIALPEAKLSICASKKDAKREVCYKGVLQPEAYSLFTACKDKLFLVYTGQKVTFDNLKDFHSFILCFDWEGKLLKCYSVPARVYALSVSATNSDTFYATIRDEEDNPQLIKLTPNQQ